MRKELFGQLRAMRWVVCLCVLGITDAVAQTMPRQDVVDVLAIGEGLCLSNLFQSKLVLQRDKPIHIWGWAVPGEQVEISWRGGQQSAVAGADRAWRITLAPAPASANPQQLIPEAASRSA